jgi:hypothetical protein
MQAGKEITPMKWQSAIPHSLLLSATCVLALFAGGNPLAQPKGSGKTSRIKNAVLAASCSQAHVSSAFSAATSGQTVIIPAGTCTWTAGVTWNAPSNVTVLGAGDLSTTGGGDKTVIVDNYTANDELLDISTTTAFRMAGITFRGGTGDLKDNGTIVIRGPSRLDHLHLSTQTYTQTNPKTGSKFLVIKNNGNTPGNGVLDHSIVDLTSNSAIYLMNNAASENHGHASWANATDFGTGDTYFFIEDNVINGDITSSASRLLDCFNHGSRVVVRFNTLGYTSGPEAHQTGSSGDNRGCRSMETYGNRFVQLSSQPGPAYDMADLSGGTRMAWGNLADSGALANGFILHLSRIDNATYGMNSTGNTSASRLGYCGTSFLQATVNTSGTAVQATSFPNSPGWIGGSGQYAYTVTPGAVIRINSVIYAVSSVTDADDLILTGSAGSQTGVSAEIISYWDGGPTTASGYPCMDQTGRGAGDLITGDLGITPPTLNNSENGAAVYSSAGAWPRQALEPVYLWNNTITPSGGALFVNAATTRIVSDRDYYAQASGVQTSASTPFDGTSGTGWGTIANRPAACFTGSESGGGVGYFASDQGSWNASASNPYGVQQNGADGVLYKCTATNTWTLYYTPYTYPHPLQAGS